MNPYGPHTHYHQNPMSGFENEPVN